MRQIVWKRTAAARTRSGQQPPAVRRERPAHLPGGHLLLLRHLHHQTVVLQLQGADPVYVDRQAVVQVLQFLLLLQARYPCGGERRAGRGTARLSARGSGRHDGCWSGPSFAPPLGWTWSIWTSLKLWARRLLWEKARRPNTLAKEFLNEKLHVILYVLMSPRRRLIKSSGLGYEESRWPVALTRTAPKAAASSNGNPVRTEARCVRLPSTVNNENCI